MSLVNDQTRKHIERLRDLGLLPYERCVSAPKDDGPYATLVKKEAIALGAPKKGQKATWCAYLRDYEKEHAEKEGKKEAKKEEKEYPLLPPSPSAPSIPPTVFSTPLLTLPAAMVAAEEEEQVKESLDTHAIALAVDACRVGAADRCCLMRKIQCGPYVSQLLDKKRFGANKTLLGEGAYGKVYATDAGYAVKCLHSGADIAPRDLREIVVLRNLIHPNVIQIEQVALATNVKDCEVSIVMPLFDGTLEDVNLSQDEPLRKTIVFQIVRAVAFIHSRGVWHRDIKPANTLINRATSRVVIADFGLAQGLAIEGLQYSTNVMTIWYRAPEILLGDERYGAAVDIWSVGLCWLDLFQWPALHAGKTSSLEQMARIVRTVGYPTASDWPAAMQMPLYAKFEKFWKARTAIDTKPFDISASLAKRSASAEEIALIRKMLTLDPQKRITAQQAMADPFFNSVRARVETDFPAQPLPLETLVSCGDLMLAMEPEPVGNYLAGDPNEKAKKNWAQISLSWLFDIYKTYRNTYDVPYLAVAIFHRFAATSHEKVFAPGVLLAYCAACFAIASKLAADSNSAKLMSAPDAFYISTGAVTTVKFMDFQNEIYQKLDMDLDRPSAANFFRRFSVGAGDALTLLSVERTTLRSMVTDFDQCVNSRGSQLAFRALRQHGKLTPCMKQIADAFPDFFDDK